MFRSNESLLFAFVSDIDIILRFRKTGSTYDRGINSRFEMETFAMITCDFFLSLCI